MIIPTGVKVRVYSLVFCIVVLSSVSDRNSVDGVDWYGYDLCDEASVVCDYRPLGADMVVSEPEPELLKVEYIRVLGDEVPVKPRAKAPHSATSKLEEVLSAANPAHKDYISTFALTAVLEGEKFGYPPSVILAQGIVESRYGTSGLAKDAFNHFGIKVKVVDGKVRPPANIPEDVFHALVVGYVTHSDAYWNKSEKKWGRKKATFAKFKSNWACYRYYGYFVTQPHYESKLKGSDYRAWVKALKAGGYAEDHNYINKIISVIESNKLFLLD